MTEAEWLDCPAPWGMTTFLRATVSERKLRLFAVACCRWVWHLLANIPCRKAVEVTERFADGLANRESLEERVAAIRLSSEHAFEYAAERKCASVRAAWNCASTTEDWFFHTANSTQLLSVYREDARHTQIDFLHDIIGPLPFCPIMAHPNWLAWNDGTVRRIAQAIYDERAFDHVPILAATLEDAGCDNADILNHCCAPGEHVRGCWVVDLLLGKE